MNLGRSYEYEMPSQVECADSYDVKLCCGKALLITQDCLPFLPKLGYNNVENLHRVVMCACRTSL